MEKKDRQLLSGMLIFLGLFIMIFSTPFFANFLNIAVSTTAMGFIIFMFGLYLFLRTIT